MKKKTSRRSRAKYPALDPALNLKSRTDLIDYDYIQKLSEEEKKWLNDFTEEYTNVVLDAKNVKRNKHNTKKLKKDCYDRNNARNRDVLVRQRANMNLEDLGEFGAYSVEDELNFKLDMQFLGIFDKIKDLKKD